LEVKITKDWAGYKKSALVFIEDEDVLKKGFEIGLFEDAKMAKEVKVKK
jgi:hypothetical protein